MELWKRNITNKRQKSRPEKSTTAFPPPHQRCRTASSCSQPQRRQPITIAAIVPCKRQHQVLGVPLDTIHGLGRRQLMRHRSCKGDGRQSWSTFGLSQFVPQYTPYHLSCCKPPPHGPHWTQSPGIVRRAKTQPTCWVCPWHQTPAHTPGILDPTNM